MQKRRAPGPQEPQVNDVRPQTEPLTPARGPPERSEMAFVLGERPLFKHTQSPCSCPFPSPSCELVESSDFLLSSELVTKAILNSGPFSTSEKKRTSDLGMRPRLILEG